MTRRYMPTAPVDDGRLHYRNIEIQGDWANQAACKNLPAEAAKDFFPPGIEDAPVGKASVQAKARGFARALAVCATCPVQQDCLDWANRNGLDREIDGVLGGQTPQQRRDNQLSEAAKIHRANKVRAQQAAWRERNRNR